MGNEAERERRRCVTICRRRAELWRATLARNPMTRLEEARGRANEADYLADLLESGVDLPEGPDAHDGEVARLNGQTASVPVTWVQPNPAVQPTAHAVGEQVTATGALAQDAGDGERSVDLMTIAGNQPVVAQRLEVSSETTLASPRVCSECGRPSPPESRYCFCGNDLVIPPAPPPKPGIQGWLLFFCLQLLVINPVVISYQVWAEARRLYATASANPSVTTMLGVDSTFRLITVAVGLVAGLLLIRRHAVAVPFVRAYLVWFAVNYFALIALPYAFDLAPEARTRIAGLYLYRAVMTVPGTSFWFLYFKHSKRVKVTYAQA